MKTSRQKQPHGIEAEGGEGAESKTEKWMGCSLQMLARHFVRYREDLMGAGRNAAIAHRVLLESGEVITIALASGCFTEELARRHNQMLEDVAGVRVSEEPDLGSNRTSQGDAPKIH